MGVQGLNKLLVDYHRMSVVPSTEPGTIIDGQLDFIAEGQECQIEDSYSIKITVEDDFPHSIPRVWEIAGKIPKTPDYHVNHDDTLCLGSHIRLKMLLFRHPDIASFTAKCIVPYLFNVSFKLKHGGDFVTGELAHGTIGVIHDYADLLGLRIPDQVPYALKLLGLKKRIANKLACPCGCGLRLGKCNFHQRLNEFRPIAPRSWFSQHAYDIKNCTYG